MRVFEKVEDVQAAVGESLGSGEWLEVTQERINQFADATGDHQWIHVDPERAKTGPYGTTIAHGYLTLSLIPLLGGDLMKVNQTKMVINYGLDKVRFLTPVKVGSKVRASGAITGYHATSNGARVTVTNTVEIEGIEKPACIAETIRLIVPSE